jgi:dipeptidyl aminopeptidase/acylaminoacyl peptidase
MMPTSVRTRTSAAAFAFLLSAACSGHAAEVPLSDFAKHARYLDVKISPDGDYLAASAVVGGKTVLALISLKDMKGVNVTPRDADELTTFRWVAPRVVMYSVGERSGGLDAPGATGELFRVNADGTGDNIVFGFRAGQQGSTHMAHATSEIAYGTVISELRNDPGHVLISSTAINGSNLGPVRTASASGVFPEAFKMDLGNGAKVRVATSPLRNASFLADHAGNVRFASGEDVDQKQKVYYRASDDAQWERVFDEGTDGKRLFPILFNRGNDAVYFDCGGICRWDTTTRKMTVLWNGSDSEPTGLELTLDGLDAFAVRSEPGRPAVTLLDKSAPEAKVLVALMQQFPGEEVTFVSHTFDGKKAIVRVRADTDPGAFYLYDADTKKVSFLLGRRPWIKSEQMASMEPIDVTARDGMKLHGYLTLPPGKTEAKNLPMVVFVHGGPYGIRDQWDFDPYVQVLATRGYAVLQINYRGSGGRGFDFMHAGYHEWGAKMQDDVTDATRWAITQGTADPARICIFGGSYGGYAALEGAVKEPDLYKCAIGYVGVYDLRLMYTRGDIPQSSFGSNYLKMVLGENQDELYDRSPIAHLDRLKAKVMLIVGGADTRVPPIHGDNLHTALLQRKIEHEWLYERTEGHGFYDEGHMTELYQKVLAFLAAQIGTAH